MIFSFEQKMTDIPFDYTSYHKQHFINNHLQFGKGSSNFEQLLYKEGLPSLLILPIIAKNKFIGTLNLATDKHDFFSKEIIPKLSVITNQIALKLDRVSAYESLQKSAYHDYLTGLPNYRLFKKKPLPQARMR
jgi:transcriptional regulator with GAF, ATPase, and Fis domain